MFSRAWNDLLETVIGAVAASRHAGSHDVEEEAAFLQPALDVLSAAAQWGVGGDSRTLLAPVGNEPAFEAALTWHAYGAGAISRTGEFRAPEELRGEGRTAFTEEYPEPRHPLPGPEDAVSEALLEIPFIDPEQWHRWFTFGRPFDERVEGPVLPRVGERDRWASAVTEFIKAPARGERVAGVELETGGEAHLLRVPTAREGQVDLRVCGNDARSAQSAVTAIGAALLSKDPHNPNIVGRMTGDIEAHWKRNVVTVEESALATYQRLKYDSERGTLAATVDDEGYAVVKISAPE